MKKSLIGAAAATAISLFSMQANANDSGFYAGLTWGHGTGSHDVELLDQDHESKGYMGGIKAGYSAKVNSLVWGVEADYSTSEVKSSDQVSYAPFPGASSVTDIEHRIRNFATIRGKIGMSYDSFSPYLTAGFAFADNQSSASAVISGFGALDGSFAGSHEQKHTGSVVGIGVDVPFSNKLSLNAEYLYSDLGTENYAALPALDATPRSHAITLHLVRLGINYKF